MTLKSELQGGWDLMLSKLAIASLFEITYPTFNWSAGLVRLVCCLVLE